MRKKVSQQHNAIFLPSAIINKITLFSRLKLCFDLYACLVCLTFYGTNRILRAIALLFCSKSFQSFESDGKSISFQLCWSIKGLIFGILWGLFPMCWWFNATVKAYWKQLSSLFCVFIVVFYFPTILENIYMICFFSNLLFEGCNTINQYYKEQNWFLSLVFLNVFNNFVKEIQKVLQ